MRDAGARVDRGIYPPPRGVVLVTLGDSFPSKHGLERHDPVHPRAQRRGLSLRETREKEARWGLGVLGARER